MVFYRVTGSEFFFQLLSEGSREDFSLWDNTAKKFIRQLEGVNDINDIKFMKKDLFMQKYPNFAKKTQFVRDIAVHEGNTATTYQYGFGITAEQQIKQFIANAKALGGNPLAVMLRYRKTGTKLETRHTITAEQNVGLPQNVMQPQVVPLQAVLQPIPQQLVQTPLQPAKVPETSLVKPTGALQQGFALPKVNVAREPTANEMQVIQWAMNYKDKLTEEQFVEGFSHSLRKNFGTITEEALIREWFKRYYLK